MLNKSNIVEIIKDHEKEISEIKIEIMKSDSDVVKQALKDKLNFLEDNCYRYKLQAKAWGLRYDSKRKTRAIANHYDFRKQSMMLIEECSELQKAICKWHRKYDGSFKSEDSDCSERTAIIDELADVIIMVKQITYLLSAEEEVSEQIDFKLDRQLRRMEE